MEHKGSQMRKIVAQKNGWESYAAAAHLRNDFPLKGGSDLQNLLGHVRYNRDSYILWAPSTWRLAMLEEAHGR